MVNRAKAKGSLAERQVADYLINAGIPCERIPAGATHDRGDLWVPLANFPSIDVKNQKQMTLAGWVDRAGEQAINAAQDAQGRVGAMQTSFALHHLAHAHNMLAHGKLVDPTGLMPAIKKHEKAAE